MPAIGYRIGWLRTIAVGCFLLTPNGPLRAHSPQAPAVSRSTVVGVWQAVVPELPRLYVLEVKGMEASKVRLVMLTGPGSPVSVVCRATKIDLDNAGRLTISGAGEGVDEGFSVEMKLVGTAYGENGSMHGSISLLRRADGSGTPRSLTFIKGTEGLVEWLFKAGSRAKHLLD